MDHAAWSAGLPDGAHHASLQGRASRAERKPARGCLQGEEEPKGVIDSPQLCRIEPAGRVAQSLGIDDGGLLDEHARLGSQQVDRWTKCRRSCTGRGRRYEDGAQAQQIVGLNDDRIAPSSSLSASGLSWCREPEDLPADHVDSD